MRHVAAIGGCWLGVAICMLAAGDARTAQDVTEPFDWSDVIPVSGVTTFGDLGQMRAYVRANLSSPADVSSVALSFRAEHDMHLDYARVHFFPTAAGERTRWLAVRRMNIEPLEDAYRVRTSFADGAECPVMADVLLLAEQVERPVIDLPQIPVEGSSVRDRGNRAGPMFAWHGGQFEMSAPSVFVSSDTLGEITIRGSDNTPVGAWAKAALAALEPCWRDDLSPDLAEQARVLADQRARSQAEDQRRRREASVGQSDD